MLHKRSEPLWFSIPKNLRNCKQSSSWLTELPQVVRDCQEQIIKEAKWASQSLNFAEKEHGVSKWQN